MNIIPNGDIFEAGTDVIVCPVNCEGVMGAGLALAFRKRCSEIVPLYRDLCQRHVIYPGMVKDTGVVCDNSVIWLAATKKEWRNPSEIAWVDSCCQNIARMISNRPDLHSIAIPALGAGLGALDWDRVKMTMIRRFLSLTCDIRVYAPHQ